jgi:hypothetical protein
MSQLPDSVIEYQLDKVDQGGDVSDLFEARMHLLAEEWGYEMNEDDPAIILPDGREALLYFGVEITKEGS